MANYYVRSAAAGTADGSSWANAYTTLSTALSGKTASDVLWVADDHNESTVGAVTLSLPSTVSTTAGIRIIGVNTHVTEPPTGVVSGAPSANVAVGAASNALSINGFGTITGINFLSGTNNSGACLINLMGSAGSAAQIYDNCTFQLRTVSASAFIQCTPAASGSNADHLLRIVNSSMKFGATGQSIRAGAGMTHISNLSLDATGSIPTTLITGATNLYSIFLLESSDLSGRAFTNLVSVAWAATASLIVRNCKLPSSISVTTGTHTGPGGAFIKMHNSDSGSTNYRFAEHSWQGSVVQQTGTLVRTGGATDAGGTLYSMKMIGSTNAEAMFGAPLYSPEFSVYNTTTGSSKTITVETLADTAVNLQDDEIWLEVQYMGTSGVPLGTVASDRMSNIMSTPADQDASSATWDTTGMTNANKQKLVVTYTPQVAGYFIAKVGLAKNITAYVDPVMTIT